MSKKYGLQVELKDNVELNPEFYDKKCTCVQECVDKECEFYKQDDHAHLNPYCCYKECMDRKMADLGEFLRNTEDAIYEKLSKEKK